MIDNALANIQDVSNKGERLVLGKMDYVTEQEHRNRYQFASKFIENKIALDVACGTGYGSYYLVQMGAKEVVGADISKAAIAYSNNTYIDNHLKFLCADAKKLPFSNECFDIIVSFETIEHINDPEIFILECYRLLKKEGLFICSTPNKHIWSPIIKKPLNKYHLNEFYIDEFYKMISKRFSCVELYYQNNVNLAQRAAILGGQVLSKTIYGNRAKNFLKNLILPNKSSLVIPANTNIAQIIDLKYNVIKMDKNIKNPAYVVAVAKK